MAESLSPRMESNPGPAVAPVFGSAAAGIASAAAATALGLAACSIIIAATGGNPLRAYMAMITGTFGSGYGLGQVLFKATPLIFTGLSAAFAFKAGLFNVGAEGQMYVAGLAAAMAGAYLPAGLPCRSSRRRRSSSPWQLWPGSYENRGRRRRWEKGSRGAVAWEEDF